jgi:hypothetical protein
VRRPKRVAEPRRSRPGCSLSRRDRLGSRRDLVTALREPRGAVGARALLASGRGRRAVSRRESARMVEVGVPWRARRPRTRKLA